MAQKTARDYLKAGDLARFILSRESDAHRILNAHRAPRIVGVGEGREIRLGSSTFTVYETTLDLNKAIRGNACRRANRLRRIRQRLAARSGAVS